jgi:metallo-beta-lactamase family protein
MPKLLVIGSHGKGCLTATLLASVHAVRSWIEEDSRAPLAGLDGDGHQRMREQQGQLLDSVDEDVSRRHPNVDVVAELSSQAVSSALLQAAEQADLLILGCRYSAAIMGFAAEGTRARQLAEGATELKIHGRYVRVRAEVVTMDYFQRARRRR